jgi:hypothetical protein
MNALRLFPASLISCKLAGVAVLGLLAIQPACANEVTDWNQIAMSALRKPDWPVLRRERTLAMTQIAVFEAANAITSKYQSSPLAIHAESGASLPAAINEAAYLVLADQIPEDVEHLKMEHDQRLVAIPEGPAKVAGVVAGMNAARVVLDWRRHDGADWSTTYQPGSGPGAYQLTSEDPIDEPLIARMKPFVMTTASQFRPGPPPSRDGAEYQHDVEEVKSLGGLKSATRTSDQTEQGLFFRTPGVWPWNAIARKAIAAHQLDEVASAYALALLDTAIIDAHLAAWEAKYTYNAWRPVTAIHAGVPPGVKADPDWLPLIATPMHPEYTCGHCVLGSAAKTILQAIFANGPFAFDLENNGFSRHFDSFEDFAEQESNARVYAGVHFRFSLKAGEVTGHQVAELVLRQAAKPLP